MESDFLLSLQVQSHRCVEHQTKYPSAFFGKPSQLFPDESGHESMDPKIVRNLPAHFHQHR